MEEKIIARVQKLLTLARGNAEGGEHERDTAMKMALNLLAKHNLSMLDLEVNPEKREVQDMETYTDPWRRNVANAISKLFFSNFFFTPVPGKQKHKYTFIGLESNVQTTKEMVQYVIDSVYNEVKVRRNELGESAAWATSFLNAASGRISQRCTALRAEAELASKGTSSGTALVLASVYDQEQLANDAFVRDSLGIKLKSKSTKLANLDNNGAIAGRKFGDTINLSKQLGGAKSKNLAIK